MMVDLAENSTSEKTVALKKIAERQNISLKYLEQIITVLCRAGYVKSIRGAQGGYRLANPASTYTVGMILRLTEGTLAPVSCLADSVNQCERSDYCPTLYVWEKVYAAINETVDSITLQDILDRKKERESTSDYVI
jgi:Rrf2 family protein